MNFYELIQIFLELKIKEYKEWINVISEWPPIKWLLSFVDMEYIELHWNGQRKLVQAIHCLSYLCMNSLFILPLHETTSFMLAILSNQPFWKLQGGLSQYHVCWCPGSLGHRVISNNSIDYVV